MHFKIENANMRILVADDNPVNREVALRLLEKLGCAADGAANGQEAVDMHRTAAYALVLMDCDMPVLDGYRATQCIRELEGDARRTPIIALTAGTCGEERSKCLAAGMDDFMSKPLRPQIIADMLERWLPSLGGNEAATAGSGCDEVELVRQIFGADFAELAALYEADSPPRIAALQRAHAAADSFQLAKVAHALSGSSMSIGATGLSAMCRELELHAKASMPDDAGAMIAAIEAEYRRISGKLRDLLGRP